MASFVKGLLIFTILVIYSERCVCKPAGDPGNKGALHLVDTFCGTNTTSIVKSRILLCFICKGLDPSCISSTTTTTARPDNSSIRTSTTNVASIPPTTTE